VLRCYITDRKLLPPKTALLDVIARNMAAGIDWIQIREKDLSGRELLALVEGALALPNPKKAKILVNTRVDVALAANAAGCHFPADSASPRLWRTIMPLGFLMGVSCHTIDEVIMAEEQGANYVVFGPVFEPLSKTSPVPPRGLDGLAKAVISVRIPVLALGGITSENATLCENVGAAGVAAISLFQAHGNTRV
jgi:thiamine-phosphate pyrophosphorylase